MMTNTVMKDARSNGPGAKASSARPVFENAATVSSTITSTSGIVSTLLNR